MDSTMPQDTPKKQCNRCKKYKPTTSEYFYFYPHRNGAIAYYCFQCHKERHALKHPPKPSVEEMKQGADCKKFLPATTDYFTRQSKVKSGLRGQCKNCRSIQRKQHRAENREAYRAYEQSQLGKHREQSRKHKAAHREEYRQASREYWKKHPEERITNTRNRRARIRKAEGKHTAADVRKQYDRQKGKCYYCLAIVGTTYHVDHVIPVSRGGSNSPENIVIACPTCNMSKQDKIIRLL